MDSSENQLLDLGGGWWVVGGSSKVKPDKTDGKFEVNEPLVRRRDSATGPDLLTQGPRGKHTYRDPLSTARGNYT